ncbi:MAG: SDR family oxidoreductase [Halarchaeum sp.]
MRVAILGCGYVGLELGRRLAAAGHDPVGVRRSADGLAAIRDAGFDAVEADVTDAAALAAVPDVDAVVFAASSGGRDAAAARRVYVEGLRTAIDHFAGRDDPPEQFVYTSSTGVYGDHDGDWVDEETPLEPTTAKTRVLAEAERVARERPPEGMTGRVVRFAGLYGPERYRLERYLDGPVVEGYLNMLHRDDAAGIVAFALTETDADVLLAVDDEPVSRQALADWLADRVGVARPAKASREERLADPDLSEAARRRLTTSKRCSNDRVRALGYEFDYPTFREGYADAVADYDA